MEAGLCAHADYVIGTPLGIMRGERDLYDLVEDYIADELPLHVYNANTNEVREVRHLVFSFSGDMFEEGAIVG